MSEFAQTANGGLTDERDFTGLIAESRPRKTARARQRPAHELRGRSIAMGLIGPIAIRPRQFDALVVWPRVKHVEPRA